VSLGIIQNNCKKHEGKAYYNEILQTQSKYNLVVSTYAFSLRSAGLGLLQYVQCGAAYQISGYYLGVPPDQLNI